MTAHHVATETDSMPALLHRLRVLTDDGFPRDAYEAAVGENGEPEDLGGDDGDLRRIARHLIEGHNLLAEVKDAFVHVFGAVEAEERIDACGVTEAVYAVCAEVAARNRVVARLEHEAADERVRVDVLTTALGEVELALDGGDNPEWGPLARAVRDRVALWRAP